MTPETERERATGSPVSPVSNEVLDEIKRLVLVLSPPGADEEGENVSLGALADAFGADSTRAIAPR